MTTRLNWIQIEICNKCSCNFIETKTQYQSRSTKAFNTHAHTAFFLLNENKMEITALSGLVPKYRFLKLKKSNKSYN